MERKIFSIAPSFNCSLSCRGCYLTTGVTTEMRDLTKDDYYWGRAMEEAVKAGYREFAMTLNPFPGAIAHATKLAKMAKQKGFEIVNVTTVYKGVFEDNAIEPLLRHIDIVSMSVDDMRCKTPFEMMDQINNAFEIIEPLLIHFNINLLWTPTVFQWAEEGHFDRLFESLGLAQMMTENWSIQHLIYKPLSIYESVEWFWEKYQWIMDNKPDIKICGDGNRFIGDAALNNMLGMNQCPGNNMFDVDPMGFARKCPENPIAYDVTNIEKLKGLLYSGIPNCGETKCNCIAER
jgi:MoaA/NifB/PqqE/SkfB family radical SAM enzyme